MAITIYALSSPTDGVVRYIGKAIHLPTRYRGHLTEAERGKRKSKKNAWIKKLLKNGLKPNVETIEVVEDIEADATEKYYIANYKDLGYKLLNMTDGGDGGVMSEEVRKRWSEIRKGRPSPNKGRTLPREWVDKMIASKTGKNIGKDSHRSRPILKIDKITNEVICEYESITEAGKANGRRTSINNVLSGYTKTAAGFKWEYKK